MTNKLIRHQIFLERFAGTVALKIQAGIDEARNEAIINTVGGVDNLDIKALQAALVVIIAKAMNKALNDVKALTNYEADFNVKLLKKELEQVVNTTQDKLLKALLNTPMPVGLAENGINRKIDPAFNKFAEQTARQLVQPIKDIQVQGGDVLTASETIAALSAGLLAAQARSLARTASGHASIIATEEVYKVNREDIEYLEWVSVLDSGTTKYCEAHDGRIYRIGQGPRPKAHWGCRSIVVALIPGVDYKVGEKLKVSKT